MNPESLASCPAHREMLLGGFYRQEGGAHKVTSIGKKKMIVSTQDFFLGGRGHQGLYCAHDLTSAKQDISE